MSIVVNNFILGERKNPNIRVVAAGGPFYVVEHQQDKSVGFSSASVEYYAAKMGVRARQVYAIVKDKGVRLSYGGMQMMSGGVSAATGVKGAKDLAGKMLKGAATGEKAIKPEYTGNGFLITEPTYRHLLVEKVDDWDGGIVMDDGMFYCCENTVKDTVQARSNVSSALFGREGFFNCKCVGTGVVVMESIVPREELYEIVMENDCFKIDGNNAVCWSGSLEFTVEKATKSLIGSAATGEGLVNVYRGTGRILVAPHLPQYVGAGGKTTVNGATATVAGAGLVGSVIKALT